MQEAGKAAQPASYGPGLHNVVFTFYGRYRSHGDPFDRDQPEPMPILHEIPEFLLIVAITYIATIAFYLVSSLLVLTFVKRFPERRIQKTRDGFKRAGKDIRQSLKGQTSTGLFFGAAMYIQWNGLGLFGTDDLTWWNAVPWFAGLMVFYDTWFYWQHRLMHTKWFFRFHQVHHRSVAVTVWSSESFHWLDDATTKVFYTLAAFLTPVPMAALIAFRIFDMSKSTLGHCGHEFTASFFTRLPLPFMCTTFHDRHHSHFRVNFAHTFTFWDRLCGTIETDYDQQVIDWEAQGKQQG
jgi:sterol desaturase/sphingolipid hydroxylase (fatty acid hydroxylase superfamily)